MKLKPYLPSALLDCRPIPKLVYLFMRANSFGPLDRYAISSELSISPSAFYKAELELRKLNLLSRARAQHGGSFVYESVDPDPKGYPLFLPLRLDNTRLVTRLTYIYLRDHSGKEFTRRDIGGALGLHTASIVNAGKELSSLGICARRRLGRAVYYCVGVDII